MKFRKKPVVIEAEQYVASSDRLPFMDVLQYDEGQHCHYIQTLENNRHVVSDGDWIIKGVQGEFYPCKPDIFAMTYEAADKTTRENRLDKVIRSVVGAAVIRGNLDGTTERWMIQLRDAVDPEFNSQRFTVESDEKSFSTVNALESVSKE